MWISQKTKKSRYLNRVTQSDVTFRVTNLKLKNKKLGLKLVT